MAKKTVSCPTCAAPVEWTEASSWRPFCSERCKLIDLGAWVSEQRAIPGEEVLPGPDGMSDPDSDDPTFKH